MDNAEELFTLVVEADKRIPGSEHADALTTMHELALTYQDKGRLDEAEDLLVEVVEKRKRVLGADHTFTLQSMHNLAEVLKLRQSTEQKDGI